MYHFDNAGWYTTDPWPARFTTQRPPSLGTPTNIGKPRANWTGNEWKLIPYQPQEGYPYLDLLKAQLKEQATAKRWEVETGGVEVDGVNIKSGLDDQARITAAVTNAPLAGIDSVNFKSADGWITLTLEQLRGIAAVLAMHVQRCFLTERVHHQTIDALTTVEAANEYDVNVGWSHAT